MFGLLAGFVFDGQFDGGYYADPEDECQAFHILHIGWSWRSGKSTASSDQMVHSSTRTISSVTGGSILTAPLLRISTLLKDEIDAEHEALASYALGGYGAPAHYAAATAPAEDNSGGDDAQASGSSEIFQRFTSEFEKSSQPTT